MGWFGAGSREIRKFSGHESEVWCVAFSRDGQRILSGSGGAFGDQTCRLWEAASGRELGHFKESTRTVAFLPDGDRALYGTHHGEVGLRDLRSGGDVRRFKLGGAGEVGALHLSSDGRFAAAGSDRVLLTDAEKVATVWEVESGHEVMRFNGHSLGVTAVSLSGDGALLATGSNDRTVRVWRVSDGSELFKLTFPSRITAVSFSPDSSDVAIGLGTGGNPSSHLYLWRPRSGEKARAVSGQSISVTGLAYSGDGRRLICSCADQAARLWSAPDGRGLRTLKTGHAEPVRAVAYNPVADQVLTCGKGTIVRFGSIKLWDVGGLE